MKCNVSARWSRVRYRHLRLFRTTMIRIKPLLIFNSYQCLHPELGSTHTLAKQLKMRIFFKLEKNVLLGYREKQRYSVFFRFHQGEFRLCSTVRCTGIRIPHRKLRILTNVRRVQKESVHVWYLTHHTGRLRFESFHVFRLYSSDSTFVFFTHQVIFLFDCRLNFRIWT